MQSPVDPVSNPPANKVRPKKKGRRGGFRGFGLFFFFLGSGRHVHRIFVFFSLGRVVLYTVFMVFPLPENLVKTLAKNLVKNLAKIGKFRS